MHCGVRVSGLPSRIPGSTPFLRGDLGMRFRTLPCDIPHKHRKSSPQMIYLLDPKALLCCLVMLICTRYLHVVKISLIYPDPRKGRPGEYSTSSHHELAVDFTEDGSVVL